MKRTVYPPGPIDDRSSAPLSVELEDGEHVEWHFYYGPNGQRSVTGYTIIKKSISSENSLEIDTDTR